MKGKTKILTEIDEHSDIAISMLGDSIWIEQYEISDGHTDMITISKSKLPDLIKIMQSFVVMLLLSVSAYGQNGTLNLDTAKTASSQAWKFLGEGNYIIKPSKPLYYFTASANKTIIRMSAPDSVGLVKVWINRKEITWTSDSTFTYKTEQK